MRASYRVWMAGGIVAAGALAASALGYAYAIEPRRLQVVRYRLGVAGLPPALDGVRIAHLTDFHVGMSGSRQATLRRAVAAAVRERPDLVALTGDYTDAGVWERGAELFRDLTAVAPTFAVLGNHDRRVSSAATAQIVAHLRAQGIRVLGNEHVAVPVRGGDGELLVVAVDDPHLGYDNLAAALAGLSASPEPGRPALLLAHVPDAVEKAPAARFALTLAGHTHGGQLRLSPLKRFTPLEVSMIAADIDSAYPRGTHVVNGNPVFVSNGLGTSGVPLRFLAPPQVAFFTLGPGVDETKGRDDPERYLTEIEA